MLAAGVKPDAAPLLSGTVPTLGAVTLNWPPPPPTPPVRRASASTVVAVSALAMLLSLALVLVGSVGLRAWLTSRAPASLPAPRPAVTSTPLPVATPTPSALLPSQSTGPVDVTDQIERGVVLIEGETPNEVVAGTGMVLTADGEVMTNYHVVRSTQSLTVTVAATGQSYRATVVGRDATVDVALLRLEGASGLDPVSVDPDPVAIGDIVVAAGNANGQGYVSANRGNVLSLSTSIQVEGPVENDPPETLHGLIETNAAAWPGDSGGPMYDAQYEVLGMTTAGGAESDAERQVYAIPIRTALDVVDQVRAGDDSGTVVIGPKAYLGVVVQTDDSGGVRIDRVEAGTPAEQIGLRPGDLIRTVDGKAIPDRLTLSHLLDDIRPGETVPITWQPTSGTDRTADITLAANPLN